MSEKGSKTKRRIIEKSLHLFSVKGYYNTSVNDILEAVQITKGGLYGHFKSKEEIWDACYLRAVEIWRGIVFNDLADCSDPLERMKKALDNDLRNYLGGDVFEGGCFFLNMLVELSVQSPDMSNRVLDGIMGFAGLLTGWLKEAREKGLLKEGADVDQVARFIVTSINGCAALYASTHDKEVWETTLAQLGHYIDHLRR